MKSAVATSLRRLRRRIAVAAAAVALLGSCGGGDDDARPARWAEGCSVAEQKSWLAGYMEDAYFWYASNPEPDPTPFSAIAAYFRALLFTGDASLPRGDVWSFTESTAAHDRFFGAGRTLGYGLFVAGMEIADDPDAPLRLRYIEPASPAAEAGLARGETIVSINGSPTAAHHPSFGVLAPAAEGEVLRLVVRNAAGAERSVELTARVFDLTPFAAHRVVASPAGTKIGYVLVKDFIAQALGPMEAAFADLKAQGVREIVLDLRYNGGGLVSTAGALASYAAPASAVGQTFALLRHSDKQRARNANFTFTEQVSALDATRVFVLAGPRTCSASELVINALKPFAQVVQIGDTTCGKPVGFVPVDRCGTTFSAVNFESVNAAGQGRYWDGIEPSAGCSVADDLDRPLGDADEALLAAARGYVDGGTCPVAAARERPLGLRERLRLVDEGDRRATAIVR